MKHIHYFPFKDTAPIRTKLCNPPFLVNHNTIQYLPGQHFLNRPRSFVVLCSRLPVSDGNLNKVPAALSTPVLLLEGEAL